MQISRIGGNLGEGDRRRDGEVIALVARAIARINVARSNSINSIRGMVSTGTRCRMQTVSERSKK